jgi:hypothetical protein
VASREAGNFIILSMNCCTVCLAAGSCSHENDWYRVSDDVEITQEPVYKAMKGTFFPEISAIKMVFMKRGIICL